MTAVGMPFGALAGLGHVGAFIMESFLFERSAVQRFLLGAPSSRQRCACGRSTRASTTCSWPWVLYISDRRLWLGALRQLVPAGIAVAATLAA